MAMQNSMTQLQNNITQQPAGAPNKSTQLSQTVASEVTSLQTELHTVSNQLRDEVTNTKNGELEFLKEQCAIKANCGASIEAVKEYVAAQLNSFDRHLEDRLYRVATPIRELRMTETLLSEMQSSHTATSLVLNTSSSAMMSTEAVPQQPCAQVSMLLHRPSKLWVKKVPHIEAYYWWEINIPTTITYTEFKDKLVAPFWSREIHGNLRAQLHCAKFLPGKMKIWETHLSEMYERPQHINPPKFDEEFLHMLLHQLPYRDDLLAYDQIDRLQKQHKECRAAEHSLIVQGVKDAGVGTCRRTEADATSLEEAIEYEIFGEGQGLEERH
ncbi:hypothetical protein PR048_009157 [Dryococelus australis]|uniref:Retrotransposon gag domain-containing protein n=1 Tax=Dryococelus australis TaxID=614101 RepID=A0ABQ9HZW1_9NEOP|nr:hypothetical protein PR048_009157 [Dryococelus australis]